MIGAIKQNLFYKLIICCLVLATFFAIVVCLIELERIDNNVVKIATHESHGYFPLFHRYQLEATEETLNAIRNIVSHDLENGHFLMVEFYNANKEKLFEESLDIPDPVEHKIEAQKHDFLLGNEVNYMHIMYKTTVFLKIIVPVRQSSSQEIVGYFEGLYKISEAEMTEILQRILLSVVQVIVVVALSTLIFYPIIILLNKNLIGLAGNLYKANIGMLKVLGSAIAKRDSNTNLHNYRVTIYAIKLAEAAGLGHSQISNLIRGAFLHDVGKIGVSDVILLKSDGLNDEEFTTMKKHTLYGVDIIDSFSWLKGAEEVVRYHHEKFDGSGYMEGLVGDEIPINARIFTIADVFDALNSKRPYKKSLSLTESLKVLRDGSGSHFDPKLLKLFFSIAEELYNQVHLAESEELLEREVNSMITKYVEVS